MKNSALNARLLSVAEMTRQDAIFADIGTDHAYLPLFLLDAGRIKFAYCCDINEGPLASARKNAADCDRLNETEFILTDGASALAGKGITDYAICGMGGELIADIIDRAPHLKDRTVNLLLQPMSKQERLREYLARNGFDILSESYSYDAGKYYVALQVRYFGKAREISKIEEICGFSDTVYINDKCRLEYLKRKLRSVERVAKGKGEAGLDFCEEETVAASLEKIIANI